MRSAYCRVALPPVVFPVPLPAMRLVPGLDPTSVDGDALFDRKPCAISARILDYDFTAGLDNGKGLVERAAGLHSRAGVRIEPLSRHKSPRNRGSGNRGQGKTKAADRR